uniref:Magnetosome protein Mad21 n=1 Tax=Candidatus Magnetananas rongchengensis TaxID=1463558 RepID=A0A3S6J4K0_9BACT|nr:magnetosome protein Mad21 [Candidatus Magnetananas rongchenensis]
MASIDQEIKEMINKRDSMKSKLSGLKNEMQRIEINMKNRQRKLEITRRQYSVVKQDIQGIRNEIFQLHKKRSEMEDATSLLLDEVERKESDLEQLNLSKDTLDENIARIQKLIPEISESNKMLKAVNHEVRFRIDSLSKKKYEIDAEISEILPKLSLTDDTIASDLNLLNANFLAVINDRTETAGLKISSEMQEKTLKQSVEELNGTIMDLEVAQMFMGEMLNLRASLGKAKKQHAEVTEKLNNLQKANDKKASEISEVSNRNKNRLNEINAIVAEIGHYEETASLARDAAQKHDNLVANHDNLKQEIKDLLDEKLLLEKELMSAIDKANMLVDIVNKGL